jgi:hypothetical protein
MAAVNPLSFDLGQPSVPIPKFVSSCGKLVYEFRNRRTLANL